MKSKPTEPVSLTKFKAHCLEIVEVQRKRTSIVISKRGKPFARPVPIESEPVPSLCGSMKGTIRKMGDIVSPIDAEWDILRN